MNIKLNLTNEEVELLLTALNEASYQAYQLGSKAKVASTQFDRMYNKVELMLRAQLNQRNH